MARHRGATAPLAFSRASGHFARHENRRRDLHYGHHYYPLGIAGGAVSFTH
jgi:hypothetical protein